MQLRFYMVRHPPPAFRVCLTITPSANKKKMLKLLLLLLIATLCKGAPELFVIVEDGDSAAARATSPSSLLACCSTAFRNCRLNQTGIHFDVFYPSTNDATKEYIEKILENTTRAWNAVVPNAFDTQHTKMLTRSDQVISYNHRNQIGFGPITTNPNALAVTALWLVCTDESQSIDECTKEIIIVESDQIYSSYGSNLEHLMLHELGHVFGLGDLFQNSCSSTIMFYAVTSTAVPHIDRDTKSCLRQRGYILANTGSIADTLFGCLV